MGSIGPRIRDQRIKLHGNICVAFKYQRLGFFCVPVLWEAGVRSYKHHFKRVASNTLFSFEEFYTLPVEIES